jgi:hypothetical protein
MKKETEGVLLELGKDLVNTSIANHAIHIIATALATEVSNRLDNEFSPTERATIHAVTRTTLLDWFTGKFITPTDPPGGAPEHEENKGGASSP